MSKLDVIEGVVENLVVVDADVNYLANAEKNSQTAGLVSVLQAAAGSPGAAHSAQAANDAGDPVEGYSMSVAGQSVAGSFWKTTFKNGDLVRVIGIKQNSVFLAIAVADPITRTIWMQPHCERGTIEQKKYILKNSILFVIAIFSVTTVFFTNPNMKLWFYLACASLSSVICLIATVGMSWGDLMTFANRMTQVGAALEIESPGTINLVRSTKAAIGSGKPELPMGVYYY